MHYYSSWIIRNCSVRSPIAVAGAAVLTTVMMVVGASGTVVLTIENTTTTSQQQQQQKTKKKNLTWLSSSSSSFAKNRSYCEEDLSAATNTKKRVLIVGCGLTGALTARQLNLHYRNHNHNHNNNNNQNHNDCLLELDIVERASYPAGRFGARATFPNADVVADVGAQVLSTVNPNDARALGGHGVTRHNLHTANGIVQELVQQNLLSFVKNNALGETDERMIWEGLWKHYNAPQGLSSVIQALLPPRLANIQFGVRIDQIVQLKNGKFQVTGIDRSSLSHETTKFTKFYDVVILCIPAPNALEIQGVTELLDSESVHVLQNVGYDSRTCETHFFHPTLRPALTKAFGHRQEISVDDDCDSDTISYLSWQDPKRGIAGNNASIPCAITIHSPAGHLNALNESQINDVLSKITGLSVETIHNARLPNTTTKRISWDVSQMICPMEAVVNDPPIDAWQCLSNKSGNFVVCGDFMTQSSFVGCVASADAAAKTVVSQYLLR